MKGFTYIKDKAFVFVYMEVCCTGATENFQRELHLLGNNYNYNHLFGVNYVPGTVLSHLHALFYIIASKKL